MLPPTPLKHHTIRVSTSTDVSKQFISSDRATAVSLPCPQGDQELVTWDLATQHPLLWALAPSRDPPRAQGRHKGTTKSPPARYSLGTLCMRGTCPLLQPDLGPNPSHQLCWAGVY